MSLKNSYRRQHVSLVVLAFALAAALGGASSASARPAASSPAYGHTLGGLTSQRWPVVVKISGNGKRIPMISAGIDLTCTSGLDLPIPDRWDNLRIGPGGAVSAFLNVLPSSSSGLGTFTGGTDKLTGRFNRKRGTFSGTWQVEAMFSLGNGQTDDCKSGAVTFTAVL